MTPAIFLLTTAGYLLTRHHTYFHDSPQFLRRLEEGHLAWLHVAYLPVAAAVRWLLSLALEGTARDALEVVSALSAGGICALTCSLARHLRCSATVGITAALLLGLCPAVWFAAGTSEIHVFSGCLACLGLWLALVPRWSAPLRALLAVLVAIAGHASSTVNVPFLLLATLWEERRRGEEVGPSSVLRVLVAAGTGAFLLRLGVNYLPLGQARDTIVAGRILATTAFVLESPERTRRFLVSAIWTPFGVPVLLLLVPLVRRRGHELLAWTCFVAGLGILWIAGLHPTRPQGQFALIGLPWLAAGTALGLQRVMLGRRAWIVGALLVGAQLALAIPARRAMTVDPEREWAERAVRELDEPYVVFCSNHYRELYVRDLASGRVHPFFQGPLGRIPVLLEQGKNVYVDAALLDRRDEKAMRAFRQYFGTEPSEGGSWLRVTEVRQELPAGSR